MRKTKLFLINGIILTVTALLMRGIGMVFNIYVANKVGSEAIGVFSLVMSIYNFAITVATSGLSIACTCIVSEEFAKKNYLNGLKAVKTSIFFATLLGFTSSLLVFIFSPTISNIWLKNAISPTPILTIAFGLPLISISSVINGYFASISKSYMNAIAQILELSVKMLLTLFLLQTDTTKTAESACFYLIIADVISEVFSFTFNVISYNIDIRKYKLSRKEPMQMKKRIINIAFPIAITSCIKSGLSSLKQFLIPIRLELSGLPYSLAISSYGLINGMVMPVLMFASVFISSFSNLLVPEFSRLLAGKNYKRLKYVCDTIFKVTFIFSIGISAIFLFFANDLSLLIYQNLEPAKWIKFLSPLVILMYIDNVIDNMLKGINEQVSVMICNIIDLITTICIIFFIVPIFGVKGYIFSICVSELLNFTISSIQLKHKINYSLNFFNFIFKPILFCFVTYIIIKYIFSSIFIVNNSIIKICIFIAIYLCFTLKELKKSL